MLRCRPRLVRSTLGVGFLIAAFSIFLLAPAGASAQTPTCKGQQRLTNAQLHNVQAYFSCNEKVTSFTIRYSKQAVTTPAVAVERNGASQPPPQGFVCAPASPNNSSCTGQANAYNLVRVNLGTNQNPCEPLGTTVTVRTASGATRTFSLGALQGCRVAIPPGGRCAGQQAFLGNQPTPNEVQAVFNCNFAFRSFKATISKPGLATPLVGVERNGNPQPPPQGFVCLPSSPGATSFSCSGQANAGNLVRSNFGTQRNPCEPLRTTVTVGTGLPDLMGNPTGTRYTFSLGPLQGCQFALPRPSAGGGGGGARCSRQGDANAGVNQEQSFGGDSAGNQGALVQQNAGCR